ncbi:hypothetical protein LCGC14_2565710 [marine sediment metagenome]|uniref:threonine-phosphate decarboxylase n=1 Tax=marine sediment metagenome TaxID=412755 RepID=A0A0F9AIM9_9ZZZZ
MNNKNLIKQNNFSQTSPLKAEKIRHLFIQEHGANINEIAKLNDCSHDEIIDFSSNINPLGPSKKAEQAIKENISLIADYPQKDHRLTKALADFLQVKPYNLMLDNGSAAIIYKIYSQLKIKRASILQPTFSEYEKAAIANNCLINNVQFFKNHLSLNTTKSNMFSDQKKAEKAIGKNTDALLLCNPNNPTTTLLEKAFIKWLAKKLDKTDSFLIVDEAFMDFVNHKEAYSVISLVEETPNLIVLGSLTKFFALPGLRIGYICANKELIAKLESRNPPWLINILAREATLASLNDFEYLPETKTLIPQLRADLIDKLSDINGLRVFNSEVNFVLAKIEKPITSSQIYLHLAKRKILIRDCSSFSNMGSSYIRIAVKSLELHQHLTTSIKEVMHEI